MIKMKHLNWPELKLFSDCHGNPEHFHEISSWFGTGNILNSDKGSHNVKTLSRPVLVNICRVQAVVNERL